MIELVKSPSTRVVSNGRLVLWLVVSLVFAGLLFAVGAQAQETNPPDGAAEAPIGEAATENGAPPEEAPSVAEQTPPAAEESPPVAEQTPPIAEESPPVAEQTPPAAEESPPVAEQTPPVSEESPPVAEQTPPVSEESPPVAEETPPVVEETPPIVKESPPVAEETPSVAGKKTLEQTAGEVAAETGSEATRGPEENSQVSVGASGLTHKDATGEVAPEISIAVTTSIGPAAASEISTSSVQGQPPLALRPQTISARGGGQTSCVRASIVGGYAGGWLDISVASSVSNISFTAAEASPTAIASGTPTGSLGNGSTVENHPSAPGSGFGGGGGGGSAAGGGGSGSASSASSTLVDALLQAAPRAMRRLRLAQPSLRTSFFVLIQERPD